MPRRASEQETTARNFLPEESSLSALRRAAAGCRGCPLWEKGSQTVFGEGRVHSRLMLVGEMPGDGEDRSGKPFVGPAGRILDRALDEAGIERSDAYVTNVVKHFKWEPRGRRRLHRSPNAREIRACLPWLEKEIELIEPEVVVGLGATAAKTLFGSNYRLLRQRGEMLPSAVAPSVDHVTATVHPSSILRSPSEEDRRAAMARFIDDMKAIARVLKG